MIVQPVFLLDRPDLLSSLSEHFASLGSGEKAQIQLNSSCNRLAIRSERATISRLERDFSRLNKRTER
jgi:hypothetical protein